MSVKLRRGGLSRLVGRHSLHTRLMLWNMLTLALLLGAFGLVTRYLVHSLMLASIDRELVLRSQRPPGPPRPGFGPPGEQFLGPWRLGGPRPEGFLGPKDRGEPRFSGRREGARERPWPDGDPPREFAGLAPGANGSGPAQGTRAEGGTAPPPRAAPGAGGASLTGARPERRRGEGEIGPEARGGPSQAAGSQASGREAFRRFARVRLMDLEGHVRMPPGESAPWDPGAVRRAARGEWVYSTLTVEGEPVRVLSHPVPPVGSPTGVVQAAYPLSDVYRAMAGLNRALLALIPVALACAALGGALVTRRALQPVRSMAQAAGSIGAHDLSRRLPMASSDEFGELAATFNGMLERLETGFHEKEQLVERLQRLLEQQRRFTADASHELRTPLAVIKANTSLCLQGTHPKEEYQQSLADIDSAANSMTRLVLDLLLLARSDAGQLGHDPILVPVQEVLERAAAQVAHRGGPPVRLSTPDPSLCIEGNEEELVRLFTNLLENALRYTPPEGSITVTARREGDETLATVTDTGAGIAPEHLPHLGERFYRVDPSRSRPDGGSGLGLSICKSIAEAHGGRLSFESKPGEGTTVRVTLPSPPTPRTPPSPGAPASPPRPDRSRGS